MYQSSVQHALQNLHTDTLVQSEEQAIKNCIMSLGSVQEKKDAKDQLIQFHKLVINNTCPSDLSDPPPPPYKKLRNALQRTTAQENTMYITEPHTHGMESRGDGV